MAFAATTTNAIEQQGPSVHSMLNLLAQQGFIADFKVTTKGIQALGVDRVFESDKVRILDMYTFRNDPELKRDCYLYTLETVDGIKGILLHIMGTGSLRDFNCFINKAIDQK